MRKITLGPSEFKNLKEIEYFKFEEDFIDANVRCIPMVVRFKLDAIGIKLKLEEWSKFRPSEKIRLALLPANSDTEKNVYHMFLTSLIEMYTGNQATLLTIDPQPAWQNPRAIPDILREKLEEMHLDLSVQRWKSLSNIQRFALLKLCRPGHENENFPKAAAEFGIPTFQHTV